MHYCVASVARAHHGRMAPAARSSAIPKGRLVKREMLALPSRIDNGPPRNTRLLDPMGLLMNASFRTLFEGTLGSQTRAAETSDSE